MYFFVVVCLLSATFDFNWLILDNTWMEHGAIKLTFVHTLLAVLCHLLVLWAFSFLVKPSIPFFSWGQKEFQPPRSKTGSPGNSSTSLGLTICFIFFYVYIYLCIFIHPFFKGFFFLEIVIQVGLTFPALIKTNCWRRRFLICLEPIQLNGMGSIDNKYLLTWCWD